MFPAYYKKTLILVFACLMLLPNLGNCYLWQDEAHTAVISKTILSHGIPMGYDGKNSLSQEQGREFSSNHVYKWHPWFPFYLDALFFSLFGFSTFVARLPFALLGVATVLLMYSFSESLFPGKQTGVIASLLMIGSVPFLLLSRQCRYYSPTMFFSMLALYGYKRLSANKKNATLTFVVAFTLLFQTLFLYAIAVALTVVVHAALFHKDLLKKIFRLCMVTGVLNSIWVLYAFQILRRTHTENGLAISHILTFTSDYLMQIWRYGFTPPMFLVVLLGSAYFIIKKKWGGTVLKDLSLPLIFIATTISILVFTTWISFFRYLSPLIPACLLIVAVVVSSCYEIRKWLGIACLLVFMLWNPLKDYLYELTHDYDGPIEGISTYLNKEAKPTDVVAITYGDMPVKFYTRLRVMGGLAGEDMAQAKTADWIILRKHEICVVDTAVKNSLLQNVNWGDYEKIIIPYPDIPFENRENPPEHHYRTVSDEDQVVIFKRKTAAQLGAKP